MPAPVTKIMKKKYWDSPSALNLRHAISAWLWSKHYMESFTDEERARTSIKSAWASKVLGIHTIIYNIHDERFSGA